MECRTCSVRVSNRTAFSRLWRAAIVSACLAWSWPLLAGWQEGFLPRGYRPIEVTPFLSGLQNPTFLTRAGDGSNRLFITEQAGRVRVRQPGGSTTSLFLDVRPRVFSGGERGLLGLAFHPLYSANGRFFIYYTRPIDGAIVVAEYGVSADPDVANPAETVLLTIPHPTFGNHNGGMLAFGPGGYLYVGVGDGGAANDPPNNAQNIETLLGKILRINVDQADAATGTPYSSPPSNPFVGKPGRDEILALGFRNPWRFSFDRSSGRAWVADVGQNAREEVNTPLVEGGNYGWRVFEGSACTGHDPALCRTGNYLPPTLEYSHGSGRCSVTGGYVYRGTRLTLTFGTYVYGDFCSGDVFTWDGIQSRVAVRTNLDISSFGEDEDGEIYVVDLGGTISRITRR